MPFMKYATATVVAPQVSRQRWQMVRTAGRQFGKVAKQAAPPKADGELAGNLVDQASTIFGSTFNPAKYLLTHATIVCSVDTFAPTGTKVGRIMEDGFRINRKYADFRVKPKTDKYINNNLDAWSRGVLLKSFETFIGGHNFVEHVQVEDLSKGRIIDAVARDVGESIYIDILIATDRKHSDLVKAIESGKMSTLSMGCTVDGTICTKCGHWAADETEMCPHIKYEKGNTFYAENGQHYRVAELCGHAQIEPTGGVHFIEASWVETPAFTGAVLRNVITPSAEMAEKVARVLSKPPKQWQTDSYLKAAKVTRTATHVDLLADRAAMPVEAQHAEIVAKVRPSSPLTYPDAMGIGKRKADVDSFLAGWDEFDEGGGEDAAPPAEGDEAAPPAEAKTPCSPFKDVEDDVVQHLKDKIKKRLRDDLSKDNDKPPMPDSMAPNDTIVKEAAQKARYATYKAGITTLIRTATSEAALINAVADFNRTLGMIIPVQIYRAALKLGDKTRFKTAREYGLARQAAMGRVPTDSEAGMLDNLSHLLSRWGQAHMGNQINTPGSRH